MIEIYDNVETFDDAINMLGCYGNVDIDLDLKQVTTKETTSVTLQEWHQDGSHVRYFPKYSALWCEKCDEIRFRQMVFFHTIFTPNQLVLKWC